MDISYIINELGEDRSQYFNAVSPPIIQTSNFAYRTVDELRRVFEDEQSNYLYTRGVNPTVEMLSKKLAALDGAEDALVLNSGASAIFASVLANVQSGDHIISVRKPYTWAQKMFDRVLPRFGVNTSYVDGSSVDHFKALIQPATKIIYLESPNSWTYEVQDLAEIADLARQHNIITICDNSYCTPLYQRPISLGIDITLQSASKYIGGHSDVVAGVIAGSSTMIKKIFQHEFLNIGLQISPFNAWLLLRGLRTLPSRMKCISETTSAVIAWLQKQEKVESVLFPLLPQFPQYEVARKQMSGACGLLTVVLKAQTMEEITGFCERLKHIVMAVSWGGHESLALPKCAALRPGKFDPANREHRMVRFYFGLEDANYLIEDLDGALNV